MTSIPEWLLEVRQCESSLNGWNLKYDEFPTIDQLDNLLACGHMTIECPTVEQANEWHERWRNAMRNRSRSYWDLI